jgi:hypothetical protein
VAPPRDEDKDWNALLQKLFALEEPTTPKDLRGVLEKMQAVAELQMDPNSVEALIRKCNESALPAGVAPDDKDFICAYTAEKPCNLYWIVSKAFNDAQKRLRKRATVDELSLKTISKIFSPELVAGAWFYIRLQQALHRLPERYWIRGEFHRGISHNFGEELKKFEGCRKIMFTPKSTSTDRQIAEGFADGGTLYSFKDAAGWDVSEFSFHEDEREILISMFDNFTGKVAKDSKHDEIVFQGQAPVTMCVLEGCDDERKSGKREVLETLTINVTSDTRKKYCTQKTGPWLRSGAQVKFVDIQDPEGDDCALLLEMLDDQKADDARKNKLLEIRHVDVFLVVIELTIPFYTPKNDSAMQERLLSYQNMFGQDFIKHLVIVVTSHNAEQQHTTFKQQMNDVLQELFQINKQFDVVYLNSKCQPQDDADGFDELHKQTSKLWKFATDKVERFDLQPRLQICLAREKARRAQRAQAQKIGPSRCEVAALACLFLLMFLVMYLFEVPEGAQKLNGPPSCLFLHWRHLADESFVCMCSLVLVVLVWASNIHGYCRLDTKKALF